MRNLIVSLLLIGFSTSLQAEMTPQEAITQMTRGINLGRCLELSQGDTPRNIQNYYFDDIVDAGFNFVRIPVQWGWHTGTNPPYTVDSAFLDKVEQAVDWGLAHGLIIIINSHHDRWILENANFTAEDQAKFEAIWSQVADRFQNKSDNLIFEIANEPIDLSISQVDQLNAAVIPLMRANNPTRIIIYSGNGRTVLSEMKAAAIPNDSYIMSTFHSYDPWSFAGEGIGTWGTASDIQTVVNRFNEAAAWSQQHNIPLMLGEWGTVVENQYPTQIDTSSRQIFLETYVKEASRTGVAPCIWNDFGWFAIYYPSNSPGNRWNYAKDIIMANTNPAPMTFATDPYATGPVSISMTATTATDASYYFTCTAGGGNDSGWQASTTYIDTGLTPETTYTYTVKARDNATLNETDESAPLAATTTALAIPYVLLEYEMGANAPTFEAPGFTGSSLTKGSGLDLFEATSPFYDSAPSLAIDHVNTTPTLVHAMGNESWFTFTLTVGPDINLETLSLNAARGGSATPRGFGVYAQVNALPEEQVQGATDCPTQRFDWGEVFVIDLTGFSNLRGLVAGDAVTFKIPVYTPDTAKTVDFDNIIVEGTTPVTCQDIQALGLGLAGDLSGDCYVNIYDLKYLVTDWLNGLNMVDFANIAAQWLDCNHPQDLNCSFDDFL